MLTDVEYKRLPTLLQTIVDADRQIDALRTVIGHKPIVTIAEARDIQCHLRHRRDLTKIAHETYGNELKGKDGTARR